VADRNDLTALVQLAYAASIDDTLWPDWAERLRSCFDAKGVVFGVLDVETHEIKSGLFHFPDADFDRILPEYTGHMAALDPVVRRLANSGAMEVFDDSDLADTGCSADHEYQAWQLARLGIRHNLTATCAIGPKLRSGVTLNWQPSSGPVGAAERRQIKALVPHLQNAVMLGLRHSELLSEAWWDGLQVGDSSAAILLDEQRRVLRLSGAAEQLLRKHDGILVRGGRLAASIAACNDRLQAAIAGALDDVGPVAARSIVSRPSGQPAFQVAIHPLPRSRRFVAPHQAAALVRVCEPATATKTLSPIERELLGFSERETQVADLLLSGHSLESLAQVLGVSHNTVRNHLQSIFRKTRTNRQSDLIRFLLGLERD
jgi:DNA-binding CsgD family transcriptional regulator